MEKLRVLMLYYQNEILHNIFECYLIFMKIAANKSFIMIYEMFVMKLMIKSNINEQMFS